MFFTNWLLRRTAQQVTGKSDTAARAVYGKLAGIAGLTANILLFLTKLLAGALISSVAVMADAFNNLSDAGSAVVTLVGFHLSSAPPDKEHPFGHGRMEYLSALVVAALIMLAGVELGKSAVEKIISPTPPLFHWMTVAILIAAIAVKLWMALFYRRVDAIIQSGTLSAAAADSRNDVLCTVVVLLSTVIGKLTGVAVDGYIGAAVALFVIWSGFSVMRETVSPLLGQAPDAAFVRDVKQTVLSHDGVVGVHDLMVHNYGPGRLILSLHAEVPCDADLIKSHDLIDCIEKELMEKYHAIACIHMDPVDTADERVETLRRLVEGVAVGIDSRMTIHDFRVVFGDTHTNLIFDLVIPFDYKEAASLPAELQRRVQEQDSSLFTVVTVEHGYE